MVAHDVEKDVVQEYERTVQVLERLIEVGVSLTSDRNNSQTRAKGFEERCKYIGERSVGSVIRTDVCFGVSYSLFTEGHTIFLSAEETIG